MNKEIPKWEIQELQQEAEKWKKVAEEMYEWLEFYKGSSYTEWHSDTDEVLREYEQLKKE